MKVLALMSGGMDSTTLAKDLLEQGWEVEGIFFNYGSKHNDRERQAFNDVAKHLNMPTWFEYVDSTLWEGSKSSLMGKAEIPDDDYHVGAEGPSNTVVPFRNGIFISMAVAIANSNGFDAVAIGAHATDAANWAYPDCSPEFLGAMAAATYTGTFHQVRLIGPYGHMTKADLVARAVEIHAPLHLSWSCYKGRKVACGKCPTCRERIRAFSAAGYVDPIEYAVDIDWTGCLPWQQTIT